MHKHNSSFVGQLSLVLITFFLINFSAFAVISGKVIVVRGDVSALQPHSTKAVKLTKGLVLNSDASVYANKKSFAKIKLSNGSVLTVGPESKVVIESTEKDKTSMVSLLTGKIRANVEKDPQNKKKVLVKTQSAVMGVRGTDFQATFNHGTQRTSLLTYEGEVAIKKVEPEVTNEIIKKTKANKIDAVKDMITEKDQAVKKGDYINIEEKAMQEKPVKINPKQYVVLEKDETLGVEKPKVSEKQVEAETKKIEKEFKKATELAGDTSKANFGFVDQKTGIYIPPLDDKGEDMVGKVDLSGNYTPPEGTKIDEKKGLVALNTNNKKINQMVERVQEKTQEIVKPIEVDKNYNRYFNVD